jgi:hypothetical protein
MIRGRSPDHICALCDEYSVKQADPAAGTGMGRCMVRTGGHLSQHVEWNGSTCVSFRIDRKNLAARRQYVTMQQQKETPP